jgi:acetyl-CoA carboxylase biotin carboxyl carrier protein
MDERPGELGGTQQPREQQAREGSTAQPHEPEARGAGARGRDDRQRRDPRHRRGGQGVGRERQQPGGAGSQPQRPEASLNMDELRELFDLFTAQGFTEFELEKENFRIRLRRDLPPQPSPGSQHLAPVPAPPQPAHVLPFVAPQQQAQAAHSEGQPAQTQGAAAAKPEAADAPAAEADLHVITSPIVGTFYRAASPTSDPFVRAGSRVEPDSVVCIIEAMKLMNEIQAEVSGTVEKVYVENGQPVEYGQPLFGIKR